MGTYPSPLAKRAALELRVRVCRTPSSCVLYGGESGARAVQEAVPHRAHAPLAEPNESVVRGGRMERGPGAGTRTGRAILLGLGLEMRKHHP